MSSPSRRVLTVKGGLVSAEAAAGRRRTAARIADDARKLQSVYETEYFVSSLLGQFWEHRGAAPPLEGVDLDLVLAAALAEALAERGGRGARLVLHAMGRLAPGPLGVLSCDLAKRVSGSLPAWSGDIGRSTVTAATGRVSPSDGTALVLEVRGVGMDDHAVAVFIDERNGGYAKHLGLIYGAGQRPEALDEDFGEPFDPADACQRVLSAIAITDDSPRLPVGETFAMLRTVAIARATSWPAHMVVDASMN